MGTDRDHHGKVHWQGKKSDPLKVCLKCGHVWTETVKYCGSCMRNWGEYNPGQLVIHE